jgi:hypothetical protein
MAAERRKRICFIGYLPANKLAVRSPRAQDPCGTRYAEMAHVCISARRTPQRYADNARGWRHA